MRKMNWVVYILVFILMGMLLRPGGCGPGAGQGAGAPPDATVVEVKADSAIASVETPAGYSFTIRAELADTQQARAKGLSGRRGLLPGAGLLYVFDAPETVKFYESATLFALTTAFLADDGAIVHLHDTDARDPVPYSCEQPVRLVLQVRRGWFADRGITEGQKLLLPPEVAPAPAGDGAPDAPPDTPVQPDTPVGP